MIRAFPYSSPPSGQLVLNPAGAARENGVEVVSLIAVAALFAAVLSAAESPEPAKRNPGDGGLLRELADSSVLEIRIRNPGDDPRWLHDCDATVKQDGTGEVIYLSGETPKSKRVLHLDSAERLTLFKRVLAGLNQFQIEHAHPESDKNDLRLKVSAGSATITARGCYRTDFILMPLSFLTVGNLGADEPGRGAPGQPEPAKKAEPADLDDASQGRVPVRRDNRPLVRKDLPGWNLSLKIEESNRRLVKIALDEAGRLQVDADDSAFPRLRDVSRKVTREQRDEILSVAAAALERFSFAERREAPDQPAEKVKECKLSIATRYSIFEIKEMDFDGNRLFSGDVQKVIEAVTVPEK
jgi:hypothetical protein